VYSFGPGLSADRNIKISVSVFGLAVLILPAPPRLGGSFTLYAFGPGLSADRNIKISVSVLGLAVLKRPPESRNDALGFW